MYARIQKVNNSFGTGYYIYVENYPERGYYYYTERDAIRQYRREFGLIGKHLNMHRW